MLINEIKKVRIKKGLSMYRVAKNLGYKNQSHLARIEAGDVEPSILLALEIARELGCKIEDIYKLTK